MKRTILGAGAVLAFLVLPVMASATNGYFTHGYGTEYKGMAGAGVALALDALAGATNPAAIAFVGTRGDVGLALFSPDRDYTVTGAPSGYPGTFGLEPGKVSSGSRLFPIPYAAWSHSLGPRQAAGVMLYG